MEFQSLKNIETAFRQIRLYILLFALLSTGVSGYALIASTALPKNSASRSMC
mgnify:CR=1 FL=1